MRVLVVSEGRHEQAGALENLLRRLGGDRATFAFDKVSSSSIHAFHGKGGGYFKRAVRWLMEAEKRGVDALVLLIDQDGQSDRTEQIRNAQDSSLSQLPRAMGVAIRTFDAWMLADETALADVLECSVDRQVEPETMRDPKQGCASLLANSEKQMTQSELYARIAHRLDIAILVSRCPSGFRPFAERISRIFGRGVRVAE
jgi:hypothetical protein